MKRASVVSFLILLAGAAFAQEFRSTVSGHVFDSSTAAVPGAKITVVNSDTEGVNHRHLG